MLHWDKWCGQLNGMCAAPHRLWPATGVTGLTGGCNMKLIVVTLTPSQFITMVHSRANSVFSLYLFDCFDSVSGDLNERVYFLEEKKNWPLFVSLSTPHSFPSAATQRGPVFSRCAFGSDLITYLFGLSYSKLHWLRVLLRAETFLPPVLLSAFHPASWPPIAVTAQASRWAEFVFSQLLCFWQFRWPTPLSLHRSQVT